jgi:hypothetical protein
MKLALKLGYAGVAAAIGLLLALVPEVGATAEKRAGGMSNKRLIEQGRQLFMNETFDGNGRTCATPACQQLHDRSRIHRGPAR